jgi:hypothetical protein
MDQRQRICAIHQPNFFPWLGYFDKIRHADVFIFMDDVRYNKSGSGMGSWTNRVRIAVQGRAAWFGCPLMREAGVPRIGAIRIDERKKWRQKLRRTLEMNYGRTRNFERTMAVIGPLLDYPTDILAEFNIHAIRTIADALGVTCEYRRQSELDAPGAATELLINLTKSAGGTCYLAGGGAAGYQRDEMFEASGLGLVYQGFEERPYGAPAKFLPGLSVIDYMMSAADASPARPK